MNGHIYRIPDDEKITPLTCKTPSRQRPACEWLEPLAVDETGISKGRCTRCNRICFDRSKE